MNTHSEWPQINKKNLWHRLLLSSSRDADAQKWQRHEAQARVRGSRREHIVSADGNTMTTGGAIEILGAINGLVISRFVEYGRMPRLTLGVWEGGYRCISICEWLFKGSRQTI